MDSYSIFLPALIQVGLTLFLYGWLAVAKSRAVKLGQVNEARRALHDDAWPDSVIKVNNSIRNQFELPVLFYGLVIMAWASGNTTIIVQVLAWLFVASRVVHAVVHVGQNYVPLRRRVFMLGWLLLAVFALYLVFSIVFGQR